MNSLITIVKVHPKKRIRPQGSVEWMRLFLHEYDYVEVLSLFKASLHANLANLPLSISAEAHRLASRRGSRLAAAAGGAV